MPAPSTPSASPDARAKPRRSAATLAVQAGILLSRLFGLVRERVLAHYLGLSDAAGAFSAALRIPNLLQTLFGEGALSASFIPVYKKLLSEGKTEEAGRVASVVASLLALGVGALAILGAALAGPITDLVAPGFSGEVRDLTAQLVAIMFPGTGLLALSAWCLGVLNSHGRFFLSYVAPVLWSTAIVAALVAFGGSRMGTRDGLFELARLAGWGTVVGAALQLGVMLPQAVRLAGGLRPSLSLSNEGTRRVLATFGPALLGRGVVQISAYIDQVLASFLGAAVTAAMRSAQTLYLLPVSLFGVAVSAAALPAMSSATGTEQEIAEQVRGRLEAGLRRIALFVVPSAAALLILGEVVAAALFKTGRFSSSDARLVWAILAGSAPGLLATTQARLCASAFFALGDTRTTLRFATLRVLLGAALGYTLALPLREALGLEVGWGAAGLTAAASVVGWIEYALLKSALRGRIGHFSAGGHAVGRAWAAALVAAGTGYAVHVWVRFDWLGEGLAPLVEGAAVLGLFGGLYVGLAAAVGLPEAKALLRRATRLLRISALSGGYFSSMRVLA